MSATYRVLGMTCDGCANSVTKAIKALSPNAEIKVNLDEKEVSVEGTVDAAVIEEAVKNAGFEFGGPV
ncbi:MAG: heavy-metal-associated domain-containing protein [Rhodospirillales bacterium]|nr:heavy-metal-associated domain-containing protein [Rhodospirillales bacterium]